MPRVFTEMKDAMQEAGEIKTLIELARDRVKTLDSALPLSLKRAHTYLGRGRSSLNCAIGWLEDLRNDS